MDKEPTPENFLLRIESINLNNFVYDTEDLSTIRGAGMLLLGLHEFFRGAIRDDTGPASDPPADNTAPGPQSLPKRLKIAVKVGQLNDESARDPIHWRIGDEDTGPQAGVADSDAPAITLDLVSKGASIVIYRFRATSAEAATLRDRVDQWLREHLWLGHATFAVEFEHYDGDQDFLKAMERLLFKLRRRQMRAPNLSLGPLRDRGTYREWESQPTAENSWPANLHFCDIDGKRPGLVNLKELSTHSNTAYAKAIDKNLVSPATVIRRAYGRQTKIRIYHMIGQLQVQDEEKKFTPAWEFQDIAARGDRRASGDDRGQDQPDPYGALAGKMAVIYIDGNKFQTQIRKQGNTINDYREIDQDMLTKRRELMRAFVKQMTDNGPYWRVKAPPKVEKNDGTNVEFFRVETLMWGGDELIWVVPAWCALETVRFFFAKTKEWTLPDASKTDPPKLTHSVGLVFCSHKSPIRSVVSLAKGLAESAKSQLDRIVKAFSSTNVLENAPPLYNQPEANLLAYQVLESFDHLGTNFEAARRRHRFPGMRDEDAILTADGLEELVKHLRVLQQFLPRTRLHQIAQTLQRTPFPIGQTEWESSHYARLIERIGQTTNSPQVANDDPLKQLNDTLHWKCLSRLPAKWYHVNELWDYLGSAKTHETNDNPSRKPTSANEASS